MGTVALEGEEESLPFWLTGLSAQFSWALFLWPTPAAFFFPQYGW